MWHKNGVSPQSRPKRVRQPLSEAALKEIALRYVGKYATTRRKLRAYLARKLREQGWEGEREPDLELLADHFAELGFVDDAAFAMSRARSLSSRGYGTRRLIEQLRRSGVAAGDCQEALEAAENAAVTAALRFAERRRIGPFAVESTDRSAREKALGAMVRAGHDLGLARKIVLLEPGDPVDVHNLCESYGVDSA